MKVKPYKRGHSPAAHFLLDQAAYYRMAQRHHFDTLEVWHKVTQHAASLVIAPGCEPLAELTPEAQYLQGVALAASGLWVGRSDADLRDDDIAAERRAVVSDR